MPSYFVQARLHAQSGLPEDLSINTFLFSGEGSTTEDDVDAIAGGLGDFYAGLADDDVLGDWWNGVLDVAVYDIADLSDDDIGSPIDFVTLPTITVPSGGVLPNECALCLSFRAGPVAGVPAGRRRGRIFIGPLASGVSDGGSGVSPPRPTTAALEAIRDRAVALATDVGSALIPWHVWSRAAGTAFQVTEFWVDNAFDTVRSRGPKATSRVTS